MSASVRIALAYVSIAIITVVLLIIFIGVILRSCFRSPKRRHVVRRDPKSRYGGIPPVQAEPLSTKSGEDDPELQHAPNEDEEALLSTDTGVTEEKD